MMENGTFMPPRYIRHPMVQTVLNSSGLRTPGKNGMEAAGEEVILDLGGLQRPSR